MCLYVEYEGSWLPLDEGWRTARKENRCIECNRTIEPGERYFYWKGIWEGDCFVTGKTCAHCEAVLDVGVALTGCPRQYNVEMLYDREPDIGFVANIIEDDGHDLARRDRLRMLRCYAAARRKWRWSDGTLMDLPAAPEAVSA